MRNTHPCALYMFPNSNDDYFREKCQALDRIIILGEIWLTSRWGQSKIEQPLDNPADSTDLLHAKTDPVLLPGLLDKVLLGLDVLLANDLSANDHLLTVAQASRVRLCHKYGNV